jgi:hypothetical protein
VLTWDDDWPKKFASFVRLMAATCGSSARRLSPRSGNGHGEFPLDRRWLTRDTMLLIHGRRMMHTCTSKARWSWYPSAAQELELGLVAGLLWVRVEMTGWRQGPGFRSR